MDEALLIELAKRARSAYMPQMDNWDSLKPSAKQSWIDVAKAVVDGWTSRPLKL